MNPYRGFPAPQFWLANAKAASLLDADFDFGKKFSFSSYDKFATAGSCFARHFTRRLHNAGGRVLYSETRHPLIPPSQDHGYDVFSARYGNIYTARQLRELIDQALGLRTTVNDFATRQDGRVLDLLRPRAVPLGFSSEEEACADRAFHLRAVAEMLRQLDVFVFTLGLTEGWLNAKHGHCYPVLPSTMADGFARDDFRFMNFTIDQVVVDLEAAVEGLRDVNPRARVLLTVSPVGLVATAAARNVAVSTAYSKSVLRVAAEEMANRHEFIDYFPSYEIITSPLSRGRFWAEGLRDVTTEGVDTVMEIFFKSRMPEIPAVPEPAAKESASFDALAEAITEECDEMFLDPALRSDRRG